MSVPGFIFTAICGYLLLTLPRRWAMVPLLIGTAYMTVGQAIQIGPASFTVIRLLVVVGFIRVKTRGERVAGGFHTLDRTMVWWAVCAAITSLFHKDPGSNLISMLGLSYDCLGLYFLMRIFIQGMEDVIRISKALMIILIPLAVEMINEKLTGRNAFAMFGYISEMATVRGGKIRAQGPFAHSILAGTVGAVCMPLVILLWKDSRKLALLGLAVTGVMVLTSASSGPILAVAAIAFALFVWRIRTKLRLMLWGFVAMLVVLNFIMKDPVYFLLARIDLTGKSTGWHRAALIDAAVKNINEWWLAGTDYTRHWMPTGVYWSQDHTDITNHYLKMGVWGGLPLMFVFIFVIAAAFSSVGKALVLARNESKEQRFHIWMLGAILFGHVVSFMSVSYFDQSIVFLYLSFALIGSVYAVKAAALRRPPPTVEAVPPVSPSAAAAPHA